MYIGAVSRARWHTRLELPRYRRQIVISDRLVRARMNQAPFSPFDQERNTWRVDLPSPFIPRSAPIVDLRDRAAQISTRRVGQEGSMRPSSRAAPGPEYSARNG